MIELITAAREGKHFGNLIEQVPYAKLIGMQAFLYW